MLPYLYLSTFFVALVYSSLQLFNVWAWYKAAKPEKTNTGKESDAISIVIPFRNEAKRLYPILESLSSIDESIEVLFIDDHSTDDSNSIIKTAGYSVILNQGKGKKAALTTGVQFAKNTYILTLDADCSFQDDYIQHKLAQTALGADMITGLVCLTANTKSVLSSTQQYLSNAFQSLQTFGAVTHSQFIASGANLLFKKEAFLALGGYSGNEHLSSGDDVFLLQKFNAAHKVISIDCSIKGTIFTPAEPSWNTYIAQQSRWASKNTSSISISQKFLFTATALFHISLITSWLWSIEAFIILLLIKALSELPITLAVQAHFKQRIPFWHYPFIWLLSPFVLIYAHVSKYWQTLHWKDREITY